VCVLLLLGVVAADDAADVGDDIRVDDDNDDVGDVGFRVAMSSYTSLPFSVPLPQFIALYI
jgi:hypothetical protein